MRTPDSLNSLVDHGIIEEVLRPLMSGKEAQIYLVISGGEQRVAKIYKEAQNRTFQNRADYTEGRKVRNSRDQRAMGRGSRHGRAQNEAAWRSAEVDMIYRLRDAGVRVPTPYHFIDGVLIMELVKDAEGFPAPRLGDLALEHDEAIAVFDRLLAEVVRMLCAGVVHGDLSDFNVLMDPSGPVVIDFPQAINASSNQNARRLLIRDVDNLHRFLARFAPERGRIPYAEEMWELYSRNALTPDTRLTGRFRGAQKVASPETVLGLIADANKDERRRREALGLSTRRTGGALDDPHAPTSARNAAPRQQRHDRQGPAAVDVAFARPRAPAAWTPPGTRSGHDAGRPAFEGDGGPAGGAPHGDQRPRETPALRPERVHGVPRADFGVKVARDAPARFEPRAPRQGDAPARFEPRAPHQGDAPARFEPRAPRQGDAPARFEPRAPRQGDAPARFEPRAPRQGDAPARPPRGNESLRQPTASHSHGEPQTGHGEDPAAAAVSAATKKRRRRRRKPRAETPVEPR